MHLFLIAVLAYTRKYQMRQFQMFYLRKAIFPSAALELPNKMKANYKDYIQSLSNPDCTAALLRVYPRIDLDKVNEVIYSNSSISDLRKEFYSTMIKRRVERILEPAFEKV